MATTYNNLFLDTRARLKKAGVEGAQLEAREILCYASDKSREQLYRDMSLYVSAELERRVEELVQRRLAGEPVAYIIGEWEFYGLPLNISQDVWGWRWPPMRPTAGWCWRSCPREPCGCASRMSAATT